MATVHAQGREEARLITATEVLTELQSTRDQQIPQWLLDRAHGLVVVPDVVKVGFWLGGRHGKGAMVVRDEAGRFSNPVFVRLSGGSFGPQIGAQSSDVVLVFTTRKGIQGIADGKVTLGADASVAAGPVGRQASAATDAAFKAEVYSYSRSKGLFAGVALDGSAITIDDKANAEFYGRKVEANEIIEGKVTTTSNGAQRFMAAVTASTTPAGAETVTEPTAPGASTTTPATGGDSGVKTYPLEPETPPQNTPPE
ncbi:MAG TPA: lipid-binding SYLF domain-containing protein [Steroidobacteraceae bacterium]|nr:lipid-binding SYLF domain-containing protein [Steroidobacteraceae bacterium]